MSGCVEFASRMTGSTDSGPTRAPKDSTPSLPLPGSLRGPSTSEDRRRILRVEMTPVPSPGQPIQLTPLWEHVVRTRRFPSSIDTDSTFREISDRLRDPEWEVRQHALRVLVDVLPALERNVVDRAMVPVLPELVANLGHPAPAVRKGALDTLRVYLCYSRDKELVFKNVLNEGLNRPDALDNFQTNVTMGVILSVPSLLFPSTSSPRPPPDLLKHTVMALSARLVQITHQEAALRSLARIGEIIGNEELDSYMLDYNANVKRDFEALCDVYNIKLYGDGDDRKEIRGGDVGEDKDSMPLGQAWGSDSDGSAVTEDGDLEDIVEEAMPPARVVLETEIKFNEETAITMTILEEKDDETDGDDSDDESESDEDDVGVLQVLEDFPERRKTPKRVHFGGEVVKLRTPDSDDTGVEASRRTRIPLPVFPATKMPLDRRRASSQPSSPSRSNHPRKGRLRSRSSSPGRDVYTYNADLSPKKGILSRSSSPVFVIQSTKARSRRRGSPKKNSSLSSNVLNENKRLKHVAKTDEPEDSSTTGSETKENDAGTFSVQTGKERSFAVESIITDIKKEECGLAKSSPDRRESSSNPLQEISRNLDSKEADECIPNLADEKTTPRESPKRSSRPTSRSTFEVFPKQERNYILMELSSPVRKHSDAREREADYSEKTFLPFGSTVSDTPFGSGSPTPAKTTASKETSTANDSVDGFQPLKAQVSDTTTKPNHRTTSRIVHNVEFSTNPNTSQGVITTVVTTTDHIVKRLETGTGVSSSATDDNANGKDENFRKFPDKGSVTPLDERESVTCSSSEGEGRVEEPTWEELGLVGQDVLNDLHNKDDWRARVRGLERVASALRTSSSLVAIEPRLGSLLHAVLGGERSCRASAAGLAVARVAVAGVSEDALRRRLPQLAWGLTRQGGPHAAQLARIAMLRLRPALLLEQLLQPHCIGARNAKTRENALQLLIFSLGTFPSTEFRVEKVASRVAEAVGDRRRRVRQAALDTLAVLAQIYEPEEVFEAGARAARDRRDGEAMVSAIRARLARKSLPLVSADGLVVYGLQISPTLQIATGADVDWIVAGSGSVSPGSGRSRGQLIATTGRLDSANIFRNESAMDGRSLWTDRPDFEAVGVGVGSKDQQLVAWKFAPVHKQDDHRSRGQGWASDDGDAIAEISNGKGSDPRLKLTPNAIRRETRDNAVVLEGVTDDHQIASGCLKKQFEEYCKEKARMRSPPPQEGIGSKPESRIPVLHPRDSGLQMKETSGGHILRRGSRMEEPARGGRMVLNVVPRRVPQEDPRDDNIGYGTMYQRRRRLIEGNAVQGLQSASHGPSYSYHTRLVHQLSTRKPPDRMDIRSRVDGGRDAVSQGHPKREQPLSETPTSSYPGVPNTRELLLSPEGRRRRSRSRSEEHHHEFIPKTSPCTPQTPPVRDTYGTMYQRRRRLVEGNAFRALQTAPNGPNHYSYLARHSHHTPPRKVTENIDVDISSRVDSGRDVLSQGVSKREQLLSQMLTSSYSGVPSIHGLSQSPDRRRRRSEPHHRDSTSKLNPHAAQTPPMRDTDKAADDDDVDEEEEEYDDGERRRVPSQTNVYQIQSNSSVSSKYQGDEEHSNSADSSTSNISVDDSQHSNKQQTILEHQDADDSRSSSPQSQRTNSTFDPAPMPSSCSSKRRESIDSYVISVTTDDVDAPMGSIALEIAETESSSDEEELAEATGVRSDHERLGGNDKANVDDSQDNVADALDVVLSNRDVNEDGSIHSVTHSNESLFREHLSKHSNESLHSSTRSSKRSHCSSNHSSKHSSETRSTSSSERTLNSKKSSESIFSSHSNVKSVHTACSRSVSEHENISLQRSLETFAQDGVDDLADDDEERILSSILPDDSSSVQSIESRGYRKEAGTTNSAVVIGSSRLHPKDNIRPEMSVQNENSAIIARSFENIRMSQPDSKVSLEENLSTRDALSSVSTNIVRPQKSYASIPSDAKARGDIPEVEIRPPSPLEPVEQPRKPSKVPRSKTKPRVNSIRSPPESSDHTFDKPLEKPKATAQLCFTQLESKDWEVTIKGLKTLTQVARHHPEQLEICGPGTLGRLIGKHVQNLRSQVSRAACLAAGEVFSSQIKGIDQELDDIAGPLLHRTADTNRFLRADSNAALDRMMERLPLHRTISVIVLRGATHQNAIVRAATARLLTEVVERIGAEQALTLPREVRDKLLVTGAKLLIDGNLDARNHAKKMFRGFTRCEGFQKTLTDAVPETILRHIEKTLKSL